MTDTPRGSAASAPPPPPPSRPDEHLIGLIEKSHATAATGAADALRDAADKLDARAEGVDRIVRHPEQMRLCAGRNHDDRWCSTCADMGAGMHVAAEMLREMAEDASDE